MVKIDPKRWKVPRSIAARMLLYATFSSYEWMRSHFRWEVALVITVAVANWLHGTFYAERDALDLSHALESLFLGFVGWGLLWILVWVVRLIAAPRALRKKKTTLHVLEAFARVRGWSTPLGKQASELVPRIRQFAANRSRLATGTTNKQLAQEHREIMVAIEIFGLRAATARLDDASRREKRAALSLYQKIRSFPVGADVQLIENEIYSFATEPEKWYEGFVDYIRRLRSSVTPLRRQ